MERTKRRWLILLGIGLTVGLVLFFRWANFSVETESGSSPAPLEATRVSPPSSASPEPLPETTAAITPSPAIEGGVLHGRAFDAVTRKAVEQFEVRLQSPEPFRTGKNESVSRSFRSSAGRFEWQSAPVGTWRVTVTARGYQRFALSELRIANGEWAPEVVAPLIPGHRVTGRVFDQATGAPIGAAMINWREAHRSLIDVTQRPPGETTSRPDGSFVFEGVPPGRITVRAAAREYALREVDVVASEETPRVNIGLGRGGVIAGQLTSADGAAVAGDVMLRNLDTNFGNGHAVTPSGEFSFARLQPGRYQLSGRTDAGIARPVEILLAENERMEGIMLTLASGRSVRGVVRGVQPEGLSAAYVDLRSRDNNAYFHSKLDDNGRFAMHGVPAGSALLAVHVSNEQRSSQTIDVPADTDLALAIDIAGGFRLSGRVTQGGIPRAGSHIMAQSVQSPSSVHSKSISSDGTYEMEGLPAGEYSVQAEDDIVRQINISRDTVLDIEMPTTQLAGHLFEEGGSVPIVGGEIHVVNAKAASPRVRVYRETNHSGHFNLVGLAPGELLLSAYKPGYEMYREQLTYGAPISGMTVHLRRHPGVEISVVDAQTGRGVRALFLSEKIGNTDGIGLWVRLDERGAGSLPSALAGSTLHIFVQGYRSEVVRDWNAQPIELRLKPRQP